LDYKALYSSAILYKELSQLDISVGLVSWLEYLNPSLRLEYQGKS